MVEAAIPTERAEKVGIVQFPERFAVHLICTYLYSDASASKVVVRNRCQCVDAFASFMKIGKVCNALQPVESKGVVSANLEASACR